MSDLFTEEEIEIAESALHSERFEEKEEVEDEETWEEFFNKRKQNGLV